MERKWKTYFISFLAYSSLHCMRMSYSHSKPDFQSVFGISNLSLGVFDALIFISLGCGFLLRYYIQKNLDLFQSYAVFMTITYSLSYCPNHFPSAGQVHSVILNYQKNNPRTWSKFVWTAAIHCLANSVHFSFGIL